MRSLLFLTGIVLATPASSQTSGAAPTDLVALIARADDAWAIRDEPGQIDALRDALDKAQAAAPNDYRVLWRQARLYFWISDDPALSNDEKSRLGKRAWEYGDRASHRDHRQLQGLLRQR